MHRKNRLNEKICNILDILRGYLEYLFNAVISSMYSYYHLIIIDLYNTL